MASDAAELAALMINIAADISAKRRLGEQVLRTASLRGETALSLKVIARVLRYSAGGSQAEGGFSPFQNVRLVATS